MSAHRRCSVAGEVSRQLEISMTQSVNLWRQDESCRFFYMDVMPVKSSLAVFFSDVQNNAFRSNAMMI